ncbi:hypothetical protein CEX93_16645, partial [Xanthomonas euvesicatoria]
MELTRRAPARLLHVLAFVLAKRHILGRQVGQAKAKGEDVAALMAEVAGFGDELKASEEALDAIRAKLEGIALGLPNL